MIGRRLAHYQIIDEVSRGGMGVVYRALDVNLGREVALKVLPDELLNDPSRRQRLLQEARAASALEHPHIAVIHEVGDADGVTYIAMELIRGEKLAETLGRGPLPLVRAFTLAIEIAEGLARAHEKGIIHRDLKPANVMVTDDGHVKIIDFGLAKLVEHASHEGVTRSVHGPRTDAGLVLGTAAYMSPEQARGERIDHRTDVFALGATLYEMVTGRPAFQGRSPLDTMQAVLTQPIPPLPHVAGSSAEGISELQRIVDKCAAKEADERFQGMKDLIVDLRTARRRFESSQSAAAVTSPTVPQIPQAKPRANRNKMLAGSALAVLAGVAAVVWWTGRPQPAATNPSGKPAVAVLYFENNTGDASLDWMRTGLTDMMVTDLSQSADIEVLGTDRLVQILQELKRADDRVVSADVVREIASRAGVNNVLVGSYVKAGDTIRITARLQETQTGRIVTAERVEGVGESSVFAMVDELTRRFMSKIAELGGARAGSLLPRPGPASDAGLDRDVTDITTDSIEAYRYYVEGMNFHERGLSSQAAPLVEKAIEIDPNFAMAYAKLAVVNNNVGLLDKRDEHAKRALSLIDRLTTRERYYIEGFYYGLRPETRGRSIEAYQQGLKLHPEHHASRHNLGLHFLNLERYPEGIAQYRGAPAARHIHGDELRESGGNAGRDRRWAACARGRGRLRPALPRHRDRPPDAWHGPRRSRTPRRRPGRLREIRGARSVGFRGADRQAVRRDSSAAVGRRPGGERRVGPLAESFLRILELVRRQRARGSQRTWLRDAGSPGSRRAPRRSPAASAFGRAEPHRHRSSTARQTRARPDAGGARARRCAQPRS